MCLYPRIIRNRKYVENKKNGGEIPAVSDERTLHVPVGCGNCIECRKKKAREWQVRLMEDLKHNTNGKFITLTFNTKSLIALAKEIPETKVVTRATADGQYRDKEIRQTGYNLDNAIATLAVRRFVERHRKEFGKSIRHWLVTELGQNNTEHVHLHGILWTDLSAKDIHRIWQYGYVWAGNETYHVDNMGTFQLKLENYVNERTVNYIVKYINKVDEKHKTYKSVILTSAGIGRNYTERKGGDHERNKYKGTETNEAYRLRSGHKIALPIYYRNKIYNEEEREALWRAKLDKGERWVLGERIDVKTSDAEYYKALEYAQKTNKELGYGDSNTWKKSTYENQRREMIHEQRLMPDGYPTEWDE